MTAAANVRLIELQLTQRWGQLPGCAGIQLLPQHADATAPVLWQFERNRHNCVRIYPPMHAVVTVAQPVNDEAPRRRNAHRVRGLTARC